MKAATQTSGANETRQLGAAIGAHLRLGMVVALNGDLGSGKTVLAQGILAALTHESGPFPSPTYVLCHTYAHTIHHLDLYRLTPVSLEHFDLQDYFADDAVAIVEWAERAESRLPQQRLEIMLMQEPGERRLIRLMASGDAEQQLLATLVRDGLVTEVP